jgi:hypothetical protein
MRIAIVAADFIRAEADLLVAWEHLSCKDSLTFSGKVNPGRPGQKTEIQFHIENKKNNQDKGSSKKFFRGPEILE